MADQTPQWFSRGATAAQNQLATRAAETFLQVRRYYLGEDKEGSLIPCESETFNLAEHQWATPGPEKPDWRNFATCVYGSGECAYCVRLGRRGRDSFLLTVIDAQGWVDQKGNVSGRGELQILGLNNASFPKWARVGPQAGMRVKMARDKGDAVTGLPVSVSGAPAANWREAFFPFCTFRGKKLEELFDKAATDPKMLAALQSVFILETVDGKLLRKVPVFNFPNICAPRALESARAHVSTAILTPNGKFNKNQGNRGKANDPFSTGQTADPFADEAPASSSTRPAAPRAPLSDADDTGGGGGGEDDTIPF